jgi:hypothetical protein
MDFDGLLPKYFEENEQDGGGDADWMRAIRRNRSATWLVPSGLNAQNQRVDDDRLVCFLAWFVEASAGAFKRLQLCD